MENNHMELKTLKRGKLISGLCFVLFMSVWLTKNESVANQQVPPILPPLDKVFVCDTCDLSQAIMIAKEQIPKPQCFFTQDPGVAPTPEDMDCFASPRVILIVNPVTRQSFKFFGQTPCYGTWCDENSPNLQQLEVTEQELADVVALFDFHDRFRSAVIAANEGTTPVYTLPGLDLTEIDVDMTTSSQLSVASCEGHPVLFFTNHEWRQTLYRTMANDVSLQFGSASFETAVTNTAVNSLTLGAQQVGISWEYNNEELWLMMKFADPWRNRLNFRVTYEGNISQGGVDPQRIRFTLATGTSAIGGVLVRDFMSGVPLDLSSIGDVGCLSLLLNNPVFFQPVSMGEPEYVLQSPWNPESPRLERCLKTVVTETCIVNDDDSRQCRPQSISFWEMCSAENP